MASNRPNKLCLFLYLMFVFDMHVTSSKENCDEISGCNGNYQPTPATLEFVVVNNELPVMINYSNRNQPHYGWQTYQSEDKNWDSKILESLNLGRLKPAGLDLKRSGRDRLKRSIRSRNFLGRKNFISNLVKYLTPPALTLPTFPLQGSFGGTFGGGIAVGSKEGLKAHVTAEVRGNIRDKNGVGMKGKIAGNIAGGLKHLPEGIQANGNVGVIGSSGVQIGDWEVKGHVGTNLNGSLTKLHEGGVLAEGNAGIKGCAAGKFQKEKFVGYGKAERKIESRIVPSFDGIDIVSRTDTDASGRIKAKYEDLKRDEPGLDEDPECGSGPSETNTIPQKRLLDDGRVESLYSQGLKTQTDQNKGKVRRNVGTDIDPNSISRSQGTGYSKEDMNPESPDVNKIRKGFSSGDNNKEEFGGHFNSLVAGVENALKRFAFKLRKLSGVENGNPVRNDDINQRKVLHEYSILKQANDVQGTDYAYKNTAGYVESNPIEFSSRIGDPLGSKDDFTSRRYKRTYNWPGLRLLDLGDYGGGQLSAALHKKLPALPIPSTLSAVETEIGSDPHWEGQFHELSKLQSKIKNGVKRKKYKPYDYQRYFKHNDCINSRRGGACGRLGVDGAGKLKRTGSRPVNGWQGQWEHGGTGRIESHSDVYVNGIKIASGNLKAAGEYQMNAETTGTLEAKKSLSVTHDSHTKGKGYVKASGRIKLNGLKQSGGIIASGGADLKSRHRISAGVGKTSWVLTGYSDHQLKAGGSVHAKTGSNGQRQRK